QTDAAKLAMHEFLKRFQQLSQDAAVVTEYAPLVRSLSNMNVTLTRAALTEFVVLSSDRRPDPIQLVNLSLSSTARPFEVQFSAPLIDTKGSRINYSVNGVTCSANVPAVAELPFKFPVCGTDGQYRAIVDSVFASSNGPLLMQVRVRANAE